MICVNKIEDTGITISVVITYQSSIDMAIKFFWMFIGSFLACSFVLIAIVKSFAPGFGAGIKKPVLVGGASSVVASGSAYLATLVTDHLFTVFWIFAGIFLVFGIIHLAFIHKKYFQYKKEDHAKVFLAELLFSLSIIFFAIVIFSSLQYFLKDKTFLFFPMLMSTLAFFIPVIFLHTFEAAYNIPPPVFNTWEYPVNNPIDLPDEKENDKLLVIAFEIAKKTSENVKTNFRAKGPDGMRLGELYYHFINDYNEVQSETPIEFIDNSNTPHEWWFRVKPKWYQSQRILDPYLTFRENKIKENTIIICERIENTVI